MPTGNRPTQLKKETISMTKKQISVSARLRRRAENIIASDAYDQDTRNAIGNILETAPDELGEYVKRAEQGEMILDLVGEHEKYKKAASQVAQLVNKSAAPDWLTTAMMEALDKASAAKGVTIWKTLKDQNQTEDFDIEGLATLFMQTQRSDSFQVAHGNESNNESDTDPAWSRLANAVSE